MFDDTTLAIPDGHPTSSMGDIEMCPVMRSKNSPQGQGGCPVMQVEENKKNPALEPLSFGVAVPYYTRYDFLFDNDRPAFNFKKSISTKPIIRELFKSYPSHLKVTLFFEDEVYTRLRSQEIMQRFLAIDDLKEIGNAAYYAKNYEKALISYTQCCSLLQWLEFIDEEEEELKSSKDIIGEDSNDDESIPRKRRPDSTEALLDKLEDEMSRANIDLNSNASDLIKGMVKNRESMEDTKLTPELRKFMATFHDGNVRLCGELDDKTDSEMRESLLFSNLINLAVAYMRLFHFREATNVLQWAKQFNEKSSILKYRLSQCLSYDENSGLKELEEAKMLILEAIEAKKNEGIFASQGKSLEMLNLHNTDNAFQYELGYIETRIRAINMESKELIGEILSRVKEMMEIEEEMVAEGKIPKERLDPPEHPLELDEDIKRSISISQRVVKKCAELIKFNIDRDDMAQKDMSVKEFQKTKLILLNMMKLKNLDFSPNNTIALEVAEDLEIDLFSFRVQKKAFRVLEKRLQEFYGSKISEANMLEAGFNFEIFKWALDEEFEARRKRDLLKQKKDGNKQDGKYHGPLGPLGSIIGIHSWSGLGMAFGMLLMVFMVVFTIFRSQSINSAFLQLPSKFD